MIVPIFNEKDNIEPFNHELLIELQKIGRSFEIIYVNDGSADGSEQILNAIAKLTSKHIKLINFSKNFGQTAAIMAGIDYAIGDIIIPIDGDQQNDPADINKLLSKLNEGYDVVSGWRSDRKDNNISRNLPSKIANLLISKVSGIKLHDYGCSLKAYRRDVLKNIRLYGEMHRFIPIYASLQGGKIAEVEINHRPRISGTSKYGLERVIKVLLDLLVVKFLAKYASKPIYLFGGFGFINIFLSFICGIISLYLKIFEGVSFILTPLPLAVVLLFITGVMSLLMGIIAEIIMRIYHESKDKPVYLIKNTLNIRTNKF